MSVLTHSGTFLRTHQPGPELSFTKSCSAEAFQLSCSLICWGDSFPAAPCPSRIHRVAKAEELSLAATKKHPLTFPSMGSSSVESLRSICALPGDGDRGDNPAGAGMSDHRARATQPPWPAPLEHIPHHIANGQAKSRHILHPDSIPDHCWVPQTHPAPWA